MSGTNLAIQLDPERPIELEALANRLRCAPADLVARAVGGMLDLNRWQTARIAEGVAAAAAGDFAADEELAAAIAEWRR